MRLSPVVQSLTEPLLSPLVSAITGVFGGGYSPTSLFADGSKGVVYDNNDLSSFYLDSAGTTAATVNGLVGLQLDKSQGLALGAELSAYASGFSSAAGISAIGATVAISSTSLLVTATSADGSDRAEIPISGLTVGKHYKVVITARRGAQGTQQTVRASTALDISDWFVTSTAAMTQTWITTATATSGIIRAYAANLAGAIGDELYVDSISVKELQGNHRYQATTGSKPVLRGTPVGSNIVTNGDFASGTGWTAGAGWAIGSGVATATTSSGTLTSALTATIAKVYRLTYTVTRSAGSIQPSFGGVTGASRSAAGTYVEYLTASSTAALVFTGTTFSGTVDNIEVMDVSAGSVTAPYGLQYDGVDDFMQTAAVDFATATSDGLARRNLLTFPSAFDNSTWGKTESTITANTTVAPDGTTTADKLVESTSLVIDHRVVSETLTLPTSVVYTSSIYAKASERNFIRLFPLHVASTSFTVNLTNGSIVFQSNSGGVTASATLVGNGWYRISYTYTVTVGTAAAPIYAVIAYNSAGTVTGTGDGTSGIFIWGAQVEVGSTPSAFQDIGTDKMFVCAGVRKLSDAVQGTIAEFSVGAQNGSFALFGPSFVSGNNYGFWSKGTTLAATSTGGGTSPNLSVVAGIGNISGPSALSRVNGVQTENVTTTQGTGNYGNYALYFGRRAGTTFPYNGLDFGLVICGKALTSTQIANTERWMSYRTGVTL